MNTINVENKNISVIVYVHFVNRNKIERRIVLGIVQIYTE